MMNGTNMVANYPVLVVDDDPSTLFVLSMTLTDASFTVVQASSGHRALAVIEQNPIAVLVTDNRMDKMTGIDLCEHIKNRFPEVQRILITAYSDVDTAVDAINRGGVSRYIKKPWDTHELIMVVREAIARVHLEHMIRNLQQDIRQQDLEIARYIAKDQMLHDLAQFHNVISLSSGALEEFIRANTKNMSPSVYEDLIEIVADISFAIDNICVLQRRVRESKPDIPQKEHHQLAEILQQVSRILRFKHLDDVKIKIECPEDIMVYVDSFDIMRVLVNLVKNGTQSIKESGRKKGKISLQVEQNQGMVKIFVSDNGPGIPSEIQHRIFEWGFTTRASSGGTGFGLQLCRELAVQNGGVVELLSSGDPGTTFVVSLPAAHRERSDRA